MQSSRGDDGSMVESLFGTSKILGSTDELVKALSCPLPLDQQLVTKVYWCIPKD